MLKSMPSFPQLFLLLAFLAVAFLGYKRCSSTQEKYRVESTAGTTDYPMPDTTQGDLSGTYGVSGAPLPSATTVPTEKPINAPISYGSTSPVPAPSVTEKPVNVEPTAVPEGKPITIAKPTKRPKADVPTAYGTDSDTEMTAKGGSEAAGTRLYITAANTKLRSEPNLKSKVLGKMPLFAEVYFLNETTSTRDKISIGKEVVNEPWVKVRTKKGTVGWVYGAYVNYYKEKNKATW
jgi:Bacterial SH3 domain